MAIECGPPVEGPVVCTRNGLTVEWILSGDRAQFVIAGELDIHSARVLDEGSAMACQAGARTIVADLSGISFIDSSGLRVLVSLWQRLRARGGNLVLHRPTPQTMRILDIVGLTRLLTVAEDRLSA